MDLPTTFLQLGIALGLGLLVGLQREHVATDIAGFRTFPLVTLTGALCGLLGLSLGGWVIAGGLVALAALVFIGNLAKIHAGTPDPGITTEVALLLMFAVGAFLTVGPPQVAVAVGGATAVLLQWKRELHGFAARMGDEDVRAVMQFALISLVVLPILPNRAYGPYGVLNPRQIWWMVVLIVALSLVGYVGSKLLGERAGTWLGGALGGLVSSTAPRILLLDEPTAGLDPDQRLDFRALLRDLATDTCVLVCTHLVEDVVAACTDVLLMDEGRLVFRGVPADLQAAGGERDDGDSPAERGYSTILRQHRQSAR